MSRETFELIETMDQRELQTQIALQCSQVLMGVKISNLLIISKGYKRAVEKMFHNTYISTEILYESKHKVTFLLYQKDALQAYLKQQEVKSALTYFGLGECPLEMIFQSITEKYKIYMKDKKDFPHELGLVLGYPVKDVMGFIEHQGKNAVYSGYWKVYGDLKEALEIFDRYNMAKETVIRMIVEGMSIVDILYANTSNQYKKIAV